MQTSYFPCTGLKQAMKDQNDITANRAGATFTYDGMNRPTTTSFVDGGSITYDYSDDHGTGTPLWASSSTLINAGTGLNTTRISLLDGLGRIQQHKLSVPTAQCGSGYTYQDFTYDALGRPSTTSNPYCTTSDSIYGLTTNTYDALGRLTQTTKQDGSIATAQYDQTSANSANGTCATTTDEAGKSRKSCLDGIGRLIEVDEPQASSGSMSNPYVTLYHYDPLSNLQCVHQKGSDTSPDKSCTDPTVPPAWRPRFFVYDSLSRLLSATNPESGAITYSYDADGNLLQKTSTAPNQTGTATQTISFCYDALNRLTGKAYSAQSCPLTSPVVTYSYDSGTNGIGRLTRLGDQAGSGSYGYDALGRISSEQRTINPGAGLAAVSKNLAYTYNLDGSVKTLTYPSGAVVTYTPDTAGRPVSAVDLANNINYITGSGGPSASSGATYAPDGSILSFNQAWTTTFAGIANTFTYNLRLQPINMAAASPGATGTSSTASITISGGLQTALTTGGTIPLPSAGSSMVGFQEADGTPHTFYLSSSNQHIIHLFKGSSGG
ncbi:MAG TPA: hypothetical protein VI685_16545 [Candidatus Angelobacter sp.]